MALHKRLVGIALGMAFCGGAWAQGAVTTGNVLTIKSADGKSVLPISIAGLSVQAVQAIVDEKFGSAAFRGGSFSIAERNGGFGSGAAAASGGSRWNLWGAASYNRVGSSFQPVQTSGNLGVLTAGLDYLLNDKVLIGAALAADRSRTNLNFGAGGNLSGNGVTFAPYMLYIVNRSWTMDASVGYGRGTIDVTSGGATGSFKNTRTFGSLGVNYRQSIAGSRWQLTGRGALMSVTSDTGSFTASNGVFTDSSTTNVSQMRLGGQVVYAAGQVAPYFGLTYVYDIRRPGAITVGGQTSSGDRDSWIPAIGLRFSGGSVYGGLQLSSERGRSEVKNDQLLLNLGVRF